MSTSLPTSGDAGDMRQRHPPRSSSPVPSGGDSAIVDDRPQSHGNDPLKSKKTYGRTPDGTVFIVPTTHDMVSQLLDPRQPKNLSDVVVLAVLAVHILALILLPASYKKPVFAVVFLFWRAGYNLGIGLLLRSQSHENKLIIWAKKWKLFENPSGGSNPRPWLYQLLKREMETKIPEDYKFEEAPLEYNTWLVFRRLVDLILMCDFVSYCLFAIACGHKPEGEVSAVTLMRWGLGLALIGFNLWVKLDAHRVVKDYAWYWGDFFYLVDQELTFDGVFEMAPHPMYSIGYAGYYGISMLAASYAVLFISIVAHTAQFAFLVLVENPHIEKTYNPPPPRKRGQSQSQNGTPSEGGVATDSTASRPPPQTHKMLGPQNLDFFRNTDYSVSLILVYLACLTVITPRTGLYKTIFVVHALLWRLWYSIGLGIILSGQSNRKMWTRHFLKFGETVDEAWRQWKAMYHTSQLMCYASFIAACWKLYTIPSDWSYGYSLLRHVIGSSLVALQVWTAVSVYESLGEFGWFFGDFFFDQGVKLTYEHIYRFLNNPERIIGTAGLWGAALMTWSSSIFFLALVSHFFTLTFLQFVEQPHMQKIYGRKIREESGLTKIVKRSLPPYMMQWSLGVNFAIDYTTQMAEQFLEAARPKLAGGVSSMVRDTTALLNNFPSRLVPAKPVPDLPGVDLADYQIAADGEIEHSYDKSQCQLNTKVFKFGAPIKAKWTAPAKHGKKDWVGLYLVAQNSSREMTTELSSSGRWVATVPGQFESITADRGIIRSDVPLDAANSRKSSLVQGEMEFAGDKLTWKEGTYELRYHHDGSHKVLAISQPFEMRIASFHSEDVEVDANGVYQKTVEDTLLPVIQNCLDRDPDVAPGTPEEPFGGIVERDDKYSRRIVYAIRQMFGIEFAPAVIPSDGSVKNLAWRICNARQVLAPYRLPHSKGTATPPPEAFNPKA